MLNPDLITDALAGALQSVQELIDWAGDPSRIVAFKYQYGSDPSLEKALYELKPPCILVAWEGTQGGNFDGSSIWKHRLFIGIRAGNVATGKTAVSYGTIWWWICNKPANGQTLNIREQQLYPGLDIMETPSVSRRVDEERMDYFVGSVVIAELND